MNFTITTNFAKKVPKKGSGLYYDPLYGYVPLPGYIREAMDLDVFQRLRGIKQLSTVYLTFPGAVHTRFDHCVGVAYLASIVFNKLRELIDSSDPSCPKINPILEASIKLASLFHDIGHGPFGHIFEMFCKRNEEFNSWTHEKFAKKLITGKNENNSDIDDVKFKQIPVFLINLKSLFDQKFPSQENISLLDPINIHNIAFGLPPVLGNDSLNNKYYFLKDIIASSFGLDRLDYLKRDAYFSGVNTGNIDIGEIISNLLLIQHENKFKIFLNVEAATALENLLQARNLVYRRLYHNSVHRSAQELIIRGLMSTNYRPEEICLLTDNELLTLFTEQGGFFSEIANRVKFRVLFENMPICNHLFIRHFKGELEKYRKVPKEWIKLKNKEEEIAQKAGMSKEKVFYDIEIIPAVKSQDFKAQIFYDCIEGKPKSLFNLAEHLSAIYDGTIFPGFPKDEYFNESVSSITVSFPYEEIAKDIEGFSTIAGPKLIEEIEKLYINKLEPIIMGLFKDILTVQKTKADYFEENKDHFVLVKKRFLNYLMDLASRKKELII